MIKAILSSPLPHDRTTINGIVISLCTDDGAVGKERTAMNKRIQLRESFYDKPLSLTNKILPLFVNDDQYVYFVLTHLSLFMHTCSCSFVHLYFARTFIIFLQSPWYTYDQKCDILFPPLKSQVLQRKHRSSFNLSEKRKTINHFLIQFIFYFLSLVFNV
jgi:hypothetical protein